MNRKQRVFWNNAGTLVDVSVELNDMRRGSYTLPLATLGDYLYVAAELPFNHKYFDVSVANDVAAVVTVETWTGSAWLACVDVVDETKAAGASLAASGPVSFMPDINKSHWSCVRDPSVTIAALSTLRVFNMYWCRFKWSANLKATTGLSYIGERFSDDTDLFDLYPGLNNSNLMTAFESGKTDWKDQSLAAAEMIVRDLRRQKIVMRREQIMDASLFNEASIHLTAALIYAGLEGEFTDAEKRARERYRDAMKLEFFEVDTDGSGTATKLEQTLSTGFLTR